MKHTELRAAVLDALEKHDTGATFFDGRPAVFDEADFPAVAVYLTGAEYTGEELDSDTWQAELHIEVFLPAQVPDSELDAWMECGYHGPAVADEYDQPTSDITKDKCSKCLSGCKFRNNVGNFGGFLSINKLSQ